MRLDSNDIPLDGKRVEHIRVVRIGTTGGSELWWVAESLSDGSAKPEGMFGSRAEARSFADELAGKWGVRVEVSESSAA